MATTVVRSETPDSYVTLWQALSDTINSIGTALAWVGKALLYYFAPGVSCLITSMGLGYAFAHVVLGATGAASSNCCDEPEDYKDPCEGTKTDVFGQVFMVLTIGVNIAGAAGFFGSATEAMSFPIRCLTSLIVPGSLVMLALVVVGSVAIVKGCFNSYSQVGEEESVLPGLEGQEMHPCKHARAGHEQRNSEIDPPAYDDGCGTPAASPSGQQAVRTSPSPYDFSRLRRTGY